MTSLFFYLEGGGDLIWQKVDLSMIPVEYPHKPVSPQFIHVFGITQRFLKIFLYFKKWLQHGIIRLGYIIDFDGCLITR